MQTMKIWLLAAALAVPMTLASTSVCARGDGGDMPGMDTSTHDMKSKSEGAMKDMPAANRYTQGVIRKVDMAQGKLTIKHGEIKNLGMPGMTMLFRVKDPAMLKMVKANDAVLFTVEKHGGALVITELKMAP
ncbi:copper-binding protein [Perlucidibaca aquatica]|uniref:copper-binding protein n=1 Tax=Perlucidibaca aquatica TaxID=1852776 RepID=UPI000ABAFE34|nr:copper-binding protein [Perlucidibaca aquatica]